MSPAVPTSASAPVDMIADYRVVRRLGESSLLCLATGDRPVVLKKVDDDCLLKGGLHPAIKERLARVRELAHGGVANLYSVDRGEAGTAWLVWEYVPGASLDTVLADRLPPPRELWVIVRELILAVEAMHARGIVHGSLHERNVIVDGADRVRLTHVSPLLYTDQSDDTSAILDLLGRVGVDVHERIGAIAVDARGQAQPLPFVRSRLAALIQSREHLAPQPTEPAVGPASPRKKALIAAVSLAVIGIGVAVGVMYALSPAPANVDQPIAVRR